ncbi:hypothetical protein CYMTET_47632 [Cymbomonas tetramitiformis]|uniref:starch synthase n=1 Tax=Cymbomonas tetramitiformis TaxID=36881 RepID=A0AAE0BTW6_9CHLO|nr:hypothetical protein CYMTET_47632 [Cymbomonas tetramitiformis]
MKATSGLAPRAAPRVAADHKPSLLKGTSSKGRAAPSRGVHGVASPVSSKSLSSKLHYSRLRASNPKGVRPDGTAGPISASVDTYSSEQLPAPDRLALAEQELLDLFDPASPPPKASVVSAMRRKISMIQKEVDDQAAGLTPAEAAEEPLAEAATQPLAEDAELAADVDEEEAPSEPEAPTEPEAPAEPEEAEVLAEAAAAEPEAAEPNSMVGSRAEKEMVLMKKTQILLLLQERANLQQELAKGLSTDPRLLTEAQAAAEEAKKALTKAIAAKAAVDVAQADFDAAVAAEAQAAEDAQIAAAEAEIKAEAAEAAAAAEAEEQAAAEAAAAAEAEAAAAAEAAEVEAVVAAAEAEAAAAAEAEAAAAVEAEAAAAAEAAEAEATAEAAAAAEAAEAEAAAAAEAASEYAQSKAAETEELVFAFDESEDVEAEPADQLASAEAEAEAAVAAQQAVEAEMRSASEADDMEATADDKAQADVETEATGSGGGEGGCGGGGEGGAEAEAKAAAEAEAEAKLAAEAEAKEAAEAEAAAEAEEAAAEQKRIALQAMAADLARLQAEKAKLEAKLQPGSEPVVEEPVEKSTPVEAAADVAPLLEEAASEQPAEPEMQPAAVAEEPAIVEPAVMVEVEVAPAVEEEEPVTSAAPQVVDDETLMKQQAEAELVELRATMYDTWVTEEREHAERKVDELQTALRGSIGMAASAKDGVFFVVPAMPSPGEAATLYYSTSNTALNGREVKMHLGTNSWMTPSGEAGAFLESEMEPVAAEDMPVGSLVGGNVGGDWKSLGFTVPEEAMVLNFVCSDGAHVWDNNDSNDYHITVSGGEERLQAGREPLLEDLFKKLLSGRETEEREKCLANAKRNFMKMKAKAESMRVLRRRQEHVLYTVPEQIVAGQPVTIHYNPCNTCLSGSPEVYILGGWNRWHHDEPIAHTKMEYSDKDSSHMEVTIDVPSDVCLMDLVFCNGLGEGATYDNKNKLDYHLPVTGGVDKVTGEVVKEKQLHVCHITVEMAPIAKVGGLGDVATSLGRAVQEEGHKVELILPKYDTIKWGLVDNLQHNMTFHWGGCNINVYHGKVEGLDVYFLDPENGFFNCGTIYGADWLPIPMTDPERFGYFSKAALEFMLQSKRYPDIIHIHDWQTAPAAKSYWEDYHNYGMSEPRMVFTIHNLNYGLPLVAEAMQFSQMATTVSPTYSLEVSGNEAINPHLDKFLGVRNGIDPDIWDPLVDPLLPVNFGAKDLVEGKTRCKDELRARSNLAGGSNKPIVGVVTRLTTQKGIHLIKHAIYRALDRGCQVVLLGSAPDPKMQEDWDQMANDLRTTYWEDACLHLYYDEPLSHLIYAGSDMLLVPSIFEPCGLSQLIAMAYGTVPIVRRTGGLADTVFDVDHDAAKAEWEGYGTNGFSFDSPDNEGMDYALNRAIDLWYDDNAEFRALQKRCLEQDWSWNRPALDYIEIYHAAMK